VTPSEWWCVPLGGHVRVGVAIFSYDGGINFGVTGDFDTAPDIAVLCGGIERGIAELVRLTPGARREADGAVKGPGQPATASP